MKYERISIKLLLFIFIVIILSFLFPIIVNYLRLKNNITDEWLDFLGSYVGGVFGGLGTMFTVYHTIHYYEKQQFDHKEEINKSEWVKNMPQLVIYTDQNRWFCSNIGEIQCKDITFDGKRIIEQLFGHTNREITIESISNDMHELNVNNILGQQYTFKFSGYEKLKNPIWLNDKTIVSGEKVLILSSVGESGE